MGCSVRALVPSGVCDAHERMKYGEAQNGQNVFGCGKASIVTALLVEVAVPFYPPGALTRANVSVFVLLIKSLGTLQVRLPFS